MQLLLVFQWTKSFWSRSEKIWMPGGARNLSFGSTVVVPTTANLAPGFYLQVYLKQVANS